eukprot:TRINITY_DN86324_c0_g1_i1.p1 TRINITY_DN86324_c0_g1~~TRINITY_DN86324_c0_g1_i1.p1  ORF type:complete len:386 (-),score=60.54 TRINITY_DN86324_c0_g1_i1:52-1155(-)
MAAYGGKPQPGAPVNQANRKVKDNFVNRVVEKCGPAVVRVEIEQKVEMSGLDNSDIFSFFFGIRPEQQERRVKGHGSGFCIDGSKGVILTNAHVVQGADRITASFAGLGAPLECEILETDEAIDVAAIRVKEKIRSPLPSMPLGYGDSVMTGDWAIVLGNPLGLQNTCTLGIVSSLDRSTGETGFDWMRHPLLQTDAAVNQGNSGGPMLNEVGEVIGMISMRALFGEGIGFAIPVDSVKATLSSLLNRRKVPRSYLGIKMSNDKNSYNSKESGVEIETVLRGSPAESAGLQSGDVIVEFGGRKVSSFDEVQLGVRFAEVGSKIALKIKRNGKSQSLTVKTEDIRELKRAGSEGGRRGAPERKVFIMG